MLHVNPDLSNGILGEKNDKRFLIRLWPAPVFLQEYAPGLWRDVENVNDDFNLTAFFQLRDYLVKKYSAIHANEISLIMNEPHEAAVINLPAQLKYLVYLQRRIIRCENMMACIPSETLRLVRSFPDRHFALLQFLYEYPNAMEMMQTNPALASMLASFRFWCIKNNVVPPDNPHALAHRRRLDILKSLGFREAEPSLVRLLGKILPWACCSTYISGLIDNAKRQGQTKVLRHLPRLNLGGMALASDRRLLERIGKPVLHEVVNDVQEDIHANTALKLRAWIDTETKYFQTLPRLCFQTLASLDKMIFRNMYLVSPDALENIAYILPRAPLPEHPDIVALRESGEVFWEGCVQCNCLFSRLPELLSGKLFAYRVLSPERATLTVRKHKGQWKIDALEAARNNPVAGQTMDVVRTWLGRISE